MPRLKRAAKEIALDCLSDRIEQTDAGCKTFFDPDLLTAMKEIVSSGLTPSSALDLLTRLIAEVPATSKEDMEQIKLIDKLLNTARAIMETRLKNEEAAEIASKLEEMEIRLERLVAEKVLDSKRPEEVWNGARVDE
jgi:hypothetical protein